MRTVKQVSELTGVSIRTLQYYDRIGLLKPTEHTAAGYRLYDDAALERLQQIMFFRELEFPLREIGRILDSPGYDRSAALGQQIELLTMKIQHLETVVGLARYIKEIGVRYLDFSAFDTRKIDEYAEQAKARWGQSEAYQEFEQKTRGRTREENAVLADAFMQLFAAMGQLRTGSPAAPEAQALVARMQSFITEHLYTCTDAILGYLGRMYAGGGEMTQNIDAAGGEGTAEFTSEAIRIFCSKK